MLILVIIFYTTANGVKEYHVDYTNCLNSNGVSCATALTVPGNCSCTVTINVAEDMGGKVYMYYALTNFYQNHRRYVTSRDDIQLSGASLSGGSFCEPIRTSSGGLPIAPCGLTANSFFNGVCACDWRERERVCVCARAPFP